MCNVSSLNEGENISDDDNDEYKTDRSTPEHSKWCTYLYINVEPSFNMSIIDNLSDSSNDTDDSENNGVNNKNV